MLTSEDIAAFVSTVSEDKANKILEKIENEKNRTHLLISDRQYTGKICTDIEDLFKYVIMAKKSKNPIAFNYFISTVIDLAKKRNEEKEKKEMHKKAYHTKFFLGSLFFAIAEITKEENKKNDLLEYAKSGIENSPLHDIFDSINITTDKKSIELLVLGVIVPKMSRKIVYEKRIGLVKDASLSLFLLNSLKERGRLSHKEIRGIRDSTDHKKVYDRCNEFLEEITIGAQSEKEILDGLWKEYTL